MSDQSEQEPQPVPAQPPQIETTSEIELIEHVSEPIIETYVSKPIIETDDEEPEPEPARPRPFPARPRPQLSDLNCPCEDLLNAHKRTEYIDLCVPLYKASIKGDWGTAEAILRSHPYLVRYAITDNWETPLHVAASAKSNTKNTSFVRNLVARMEVDDLLLQNKSGDTPLCLAATTDGKVDIAVIMVQKNGILPTIPNNDKMMPLGMAALFRNRDMVTYLYDISEHMNGPGWEDPKYERWVFTRCVEADFFDIALQMLRDHPEIAKEGSGLGALAGKPEAFTEIKPNIISRLVNSVSGGKLGSAASESKALKLLIQIWYRVARMPKTTIDTILRGPELVINGTGTSEYPFRILFVAAEMGNTKFLVELINGYPDVIWNQNDDGQNIFHFAVSHRLEGIYNLLYEIGSIKALIYPLKDPQGNNILHLAGSIASKDRLEDVSGEAFQMQRELLWFKEVGSTLPPYFAEQRNKSGKTPRDLFTETHKELLSEGEKWMKGTANKCTVVAALIATIVFGVAYTIPGGYDQHTGFPMFRDKGSFIAFVVLDAISLILSSTSILLFLSILTSRYTQEDFIKSLPKKLMLGISMLFLSIVTMMLAFSVSFFVLYDHKYFFIIAGCISLLALVPIISYARLHFPLLKDIILSIYWSKYLFKTKKQIFTI